jgi:hypothetical protein
MPYWGKTLLKITGGFLLLVFILWSAAYAYFVTHKQAILQQIVTQLNEGLNGKLTIERIEPEFLKGFPGVSVALKNVTLQDSLWSLHHHDLLKAKEIFVSVNAISVVQGNPRIRNIDIQDASVYIYTDSLGYSNTSVFASKKTDSASKQRDLRISHIFLNNVDLVFQNESKFKLFHLGIAGMEVKVDYSAAGWTARLKTKTRVKDFAFNTAKGSFIKNKLLKASLEIEYDQLQRILTIPAQELELDNDEVSFAAKFFLAQLPSTFAIELKADDILYKNAVSLLSPSISSKLNIVNFQKPLDVLAQIKGRMKFRDTPLVRVTYNVRNNSIITPAGTVENCGFTGNFDNELIPGLGHNDRNSRITLHAFRGSWEGISFQADTLLVTNLLSPILEGRFVSQFPLSKLNSIIGGKSFTFDQGSANLNLHYKGGISPTDTNKAYVYGSINVNKAAMTYIPRDLKFTNSSASVNFRGRDVFVRDARLQGGKTQLQMEGKLLNFLSLYYTDPGKMLLDWNIKSAQIDLIEFISFLGKRKAGQFTAAAGKAGTPASRMSAQFDKLMEASSVHMNVQVSKLEYYSFAAQNIIADLSLREAGIFLNNVSVNHAGGKLSVNGVIGQGAATNNFTLKANIENVNVQELFRSFQNFGQDAIIDKNIRGSIFAKADVNGKLSDKGKIVPNSLIGFVTFDLQDGALKDFEPFQKIGKIIFRNRDMSNVMIRKLQNRLEIQGDKIVINPMYIESSALNIQIAGIYGLKQGTDINIDVPLRNPKRDELILNDSTRMDKGMKGIVMHLKATDGADGNVKIKLVAKGKKGK